METQRELPYGLTTVEVQLHTGGDVTLKAADEGEAGEVEADPGVEVEIQGDAARIYRQHGGPADVEARLPTSVREVRCRTAHGDVEVKGLSADVFARTGRGDVELSDGRGRAEAETGRGEVSVESWQGPVRAQTGHGDIEAERIGGDLEARTGSGSLEIDDVAGRVDAHSGHGNVVVGRLVGEASLHTGHGDVVATDLAGANLTAHTGHGEIALGGRLAGVRASTGRGKIVCRCALAEGSHELTASHGDIVLDLPADAEVRVDAVTGHGRVETNLPLVKVGRPGPEGAHGRRFVGSVGSAEPKATVLLRTGRGDIRITRAGGGAPSSLDATQSAGSEPWTSAGAGTATERAWQETLKAHPAWPDEGDDLAEQIAEARERAEEEARQRAEEAAAEVQEQMARLGDEMGELGKRIGEQVSAFFGPGPATPPAPSAPAEPAPPAQPAAPEPGTGGQAGPRAEPGKDQQMAILEAVSRGELSVDEALALLGKLEGTPGS